ncbi:MAG: ABC transporter ATP-binding protein [Polyangiales bacterium]
MPKLTVERASKSFKGLRAVSDVSFDVDEHEIVGLIGPNGAGKTTLFNLIAGALKLDQGAVRFGSLALSSMRSDQICRAGVGRTFQLVRPFAGLSVRDNVVVGALARERSIPAARARADALLEQLGLAPKARHAASTLTLPDRKRLEVARALATGPRLLLLDEVMAGLRPAEVDVIVEVFRTLHKQEGIAILLIEHVMRATMALADRIVVLHHGEVIARGKPAEVVQDKAVLEVYLGADLESEGRAPAESEGRAPAESEGLAFPEPEGRAHKVGEA